MGKLINAIQEWRSRNPEGRVFIPMPWNNISFYTYEHIPFFLRFKVRPGWWLIGFAIFLVFSGHVFSVKVFLATGLSLVLVLLLAFRRSRKLSAAWEVTDVKVKSRVLEKEKFDVTFIIRNRSSLYFSSLILYFRFSGSRKTNFVQIVGPFKPGEKRKEIFQINADIGMGTYTLDSVRVITGDEAGLFPHCVGYEFEKAIEVIPEDIPLENFRVRQAGLSMHTGAFEIRERGDSASFLGIREYRSGDSIRRIAWKESARRGDLVVKEFERICASDATIFFDQNRVGHSEFKGVSSIESMRDSLLSLARCLMGQQMRLQLISAVRHVGFGIGDYHMCQLMDIVKDLKPVDVRFDKLLLNHVALVPVDSVVVMLFCTEGVDYENLWRAVIALDNRRVDIHFVAFDSASYATKVRKEANLDMVNYGFMKKMFGQAARVKDAGFGRLVSGLPDRIHIVRAGETLADVYNMKHTV